VTGGDDMPLLLYKVVGNVKNGKYRIGVLERAINVGPQFLRRCSVYYAAANTDRAQFSDDVSAVGCVVVAWENILA